jgi:hypothetical protein
MDVGAQDTMRYAYFPATRRLAIDLNGKVTVYDTQDHQISGVSQQQPGLGSLSFSSQLGDVDLSGLHVVSGAEGPRTALIQRRRMAAEQEHATGKDRF